MLFVKSKEKIEVKICKILQFMEHRRFETIEELCNQIGVQDGVYAVNLIENNSGDTVCDDFLIGTIGVIDNNEKVYYDIQLFYIKDNVGNYYITETELLERVN